MYFRVLIAQDTCQKNRAKMKFPDLRKIPSIPACLVNESSMRFSWDNGLLETPIEPSNILERRDGDRTADVGLFRSSVDSKRLATYFSNEFLLYRVLIEKRIGTY
jgi:hypothetical protein